MPPTSILKHLCYSRGMDKYRYNNSSAKYERKLGLTAWIYTWPGGSHFGEAVAGSHGIFLVIVRSQVQCLVGAFCYCCFCNKCQSRIFSLEYHHFLFFRYFLSIPTSFLFLIICAMHASYLTHTQ